MTLSSTTRSQIYTGPQASPLTIPFRFFSGPSEADLAVYLYQIGSATQPQLLVLNTDYTIQNNGYTGGTLTLLANSGNLASGYRLTILGVPAETQLTSLQNQTAYNPLAVENGLDLLTMITQAVSDQSALAIQAPPGDVSRTLTLPTVANSKSQFLATDSNGNLITAAGVTGVPISAAMTPVVESATLLQAIAAMGPWGSALVTSALGTTARSLATRASDVVNVLDFGADNTGSADCSAAILLAYASRATNGAGCALYFPAGTYKVSSNLPFNQSGALTIYGDGAANTVIAINFAATDVMTVANVPYLTIHDIQFLGNVVRNAGTWVLTTSGQAVVSIFNTIVNLNLGGVWNIITSSVLQMTNNFASTTGTVAGNQTGDTVLRISHVSQATIVGNYFNSGNNTIAWNRAPCVWVGSASASASNTCHGYTGNRFVGGGPRSTWVVSGITSSGGSFVITTSATHDFSSGDFVVLRGMTPTAYNNVFRITSATSNTITVTSSLNPGTSTVQGTAESIATCFYVANDQGSVNESQLTGNIFEAQAYIAYGSASVYFDGRRGPHVIEGWTLNGNYYDFGATGLLLSGKDNGMGIPSVYGVSYSGGLHENSTRCVHLEGVAGISITGLQCDGFGQIQNGAGGSAFGDALSATGTGSVSIHIFDGAATPQTQGVTIANCNLGMGRNWSLANMANEGFNSGLVLDGTGIQDVLVVGCQIYGYDANGAVKFDNSAQASGSRWKFKDNQINSAGTTVTPVVIPTVASATTTVLPPGADVVIISGTATITTLNGANVGRQVTLISSGGFALAAGGNIAYAGSFPVAVGLMTTATFDGTNWYIR